MGGRRPFALHMRHHHHFRYTATRTKLTFSLLPIATTGRNHRNIRALNIFNSGDIVRGNQQHTVLRIRRRLNRTSRHYHITTGHRLIMLNTSRNQYQHRRLSKKLQVSRALRTTLTREIRNSGQRVTFTRILRLVGRTQHITTSILTRRGRTVNILRVVRHRHTSQRPSTFLRARQDTFITRIQTIKRIINTMNTNRRLMRRQNFRQNTPQNMGRRTIKLRHLRLHTSLTVDLIPKYFLVAITNHIMARQVDRPPILLRVMVKPLPRFNRNIPNRRHQINFRQHRLPYDNLNTILTGLRHIQPTKLNPNTASANGAVQFILFRRHRQAFNRHLFTPRSFRRQLHQAPTTTHINMKIGVFFQVGRRQPLQRTLSTD